MGLFKKTLKREKVEKLLLDRDTYENEAKISYVLGDLNRSRRLLNKADRCQRKARKLLLELEGK